MARNILLVSYDPDWVQQYKEGAARLTAVFQPVLSAIHHIDKPSIPGIKARPIINILFVGQNIAAVNALIEPITSLDHILKGEYSLRPAQ